MQHHYLKTGSRPATENKARPDVGAIVKGVITDVRRDKDKAVRQYSQKFDRWTPESFKLSQSEIDAAIAACPEQTIADIKQVQASVKKFAEAQRQSIKDFELEMSPVRLLSHSFAGQR